MLKRFKVLETISKIEVSNNDDSNDASRYHGMVWCNRFDSPLLRSAHRGLSLSTVGLSRRSYRPGVGEAQTSGYRGILCVNMSVKYIDGLF